MGYLDIGTDCVVYLYECFQFETKKNLAKVMGHLDIRPDCVAYLCECCQFEIVGTKNLAMSRVGVCGIFV